MTSAATPRRAQPRHDPLLRRVGSVLYWMAVVVVGAFGAYFTLTNYPWLGTAVVLLILVLTGYSEWKRRARHRALERARVQARAQGR